MVIEISSVSRDLSEIARRVGGVVQGHKVILPDTVGHGYFKQFYFGDTLGMVVMDCTFHEVFSFKLMPAEQSTGALTLVFRKAFNPALPPTVHVTTKALQMDVYFLPQAPIQAIIISIDLGYLSTLLQTDHDVPEPALQALLTGKEPLHFEEPMTAEIKHVIDAIAQYDKAAQPLGGFFHRVKAEELVYLYMTLEGADFYAD